MKRLFVSGLIVLVLVALVTSAAQSKKSKMHFYHGPTVPDIFISVVSHTTQVIEFEIKVKFGGIHLYHLVLDGDEPLAEGWYRTSGVRPDTYSIKMKAKKNCVFQSGKKYRLCVGDVSPELVYARASVNYQCLIDYEFVLD